MTWVNDIEVILNNIIEDGTIKNFDDFLYFLNNLKMVEYVHSYESFYNAIKYKLDDDRIEYEAGEVIMDWLDKIESIHPYFDELDEDIIEVIETVGGEGEGDNWHLVIKHIPSNRYLKANGYYASYSGFEYDDSEFYEVKPIEKTIIVYE